MSLPVIHRSRRFRAGVDNGLVLLPGSMARNASVGGSGDALIVRTDTGWAAIKSGEIPMPGLRRVENLCTMPDPYPARDVPSQGWGNPNWNVNYDSSDGGLSSIDPSIVTIDGRNYRKLSLTPGSVSNATVNFLHSTNSVAHNKKTTVSFVAFADSPVTLWLYFAGSYHSVQLGTTPKRIAHSLLWYSPWLYLAFQHRASDGPITFYLEIGSPMIEVDTSLPSEILLGDTDYDFGADGVAYFAYENPYTVDSNGVVTDTGSRVPLVGGGVIAPGAETENIKNNSFSELGAGGSDVFANWTESVSGSSTINQETSDLPAGFATACRIDMDASASAASVTQTLNLAVTEGDVLWLSAIVKAENASGLTFRITIDDGAGGSVQYLDAAGTAWTTTVSSFAPSDLPTTWNDWHWKLPAIPTGITRLVSLEIKGSGASVSHRFTDVMLGGEAKHVRVRTTTTAVSRGATILPLNRKLGVRNTVILELDAAPDGAGVLLADAQNRALIERLSDGKVRFTSPNGSTVTTTWTMNVSLAANLWDGGVKVSLDGAPTETLTGDFDWQAADWLYLGGLPNGTQFIGVPFSTVDIK